LEREHTGVQLASNDPHEYSWLGKTQERLYASALLYLSNENHWQLVVLIIYWSQGFNTDSSH